VSYVVIRGLYFTKKQNNILQYKLLKNPAAIVPCESVLYICQESSVKNNLKYKPLITCALGRNDAPHKSVTCLDKTSTPDRAFNRKKSCWSSVLYICQESSVKNNLFCLTEDENNNILECVNLSALTHWIPSEAPELISGFEWGSCYSILSFMCCYVDHRLCVVVSFYFDHGVICPSIFDDLNAPLVCSTLFCVNIFLFPVNPSYTYARKVPLKTIYFV
jgi:hypothetical protein